MSNDDGILSRWSRRKALARSGSGSVPGEPPNAPPTAVAPEASAALPVVAAVASAPAGPVAPAPSLPPGPAPPLPTLEDVARLTHDSEFSRFMLPGVDDSVKRAAMKKLFSDPHFNVMDGLDTYIDDYGIPDPIPEAMLRRMAQSKFLRLFDEDPPQPEAQTSAAPPAASADGAVAPALPQSHPCPSGDDASEPVPNTDEDTALRLQPDDAAGAAGAGPHRPGTRP